MKKTKYPGVQYYDAKDGTRTYYIRYKNLSGKLIRQKVGTKSEGFTPLYCKKLRDETLVKLRFGEDGPIKSRKKAKLFKDVADEYFEDCEARSRKKLESVYNRHLEYLGNRDIEEINEDTIKRLRKRKLEEKSIKTERGLAPKTVNNILAVLSTILTHALKKHYIKFVPHIEKAKVNNTRTRFLTTDEINQLYKAIDESNIRTKDRVRLFVKISLITGARLGSVLTIKGKDINRANGTVTIENHKTSNTYQSFLPDDVLAIIPPLKPHQRLIDISDSKQLQRPLQTILNDLFNVGLNTGDRKERVVIHTLRHTFASHLAINGAPLQIIQKLMDHTDIAMTLKYAKLMPNSGREDVEKLYG